MAHKQPERFKAEQQALRKVQVHFEFQQELMHRVRTEAAHHKLSPSDYVRKVVGLPYSKIQRPRISLSFSEMDMSILADKYSVEPNTLVLKKHVANEIEKFFKNR